MLHTVSYTKPRRERCMLDATLFLLACVQWQHQQRLSESMEASNRIMAAKEESLKHTHTHTHARARARTHAHTL